MMLCGCCLLLKVRMRWQIRDFGLHFCAVSGSLFVICCWSWMKSRLLPSLLWVVLRPIHQVLSTLPHVFLRIEVILQNDLLYNGELLIDGYSIQLFELHNISATVTFVPPFRPPCIGGDNTWRCTWWYHCMLFKFPTGTFPHSILFDICHKNVDDSTVGVLRNAGILRKHFQYISICRYNIRCSNCGYIVSWAFLNWILHVTNDPNNVLSAVQYHHFRQIFN